MNQPIDSGLTHEGVIFAALAMLRRLTFFIAAMCLLSSCEKKEDALVLPKPGTASHASVDMGAHYEQQIFFDFKTGAVVFASDWTSWDLAFEASPDGRHVFINDGNSLFVYNMHTQDMNFTDLPSLKAADWQYDASCGLPDSTGIGEWRGADGKTKGEVYIVRAPSGTYQKMRILASDATSYTIEWAPLEAKGTPTTVQLAKNADYNYIYFSFTKGIVKPEPQKTTWDVVFTRYRPLVYDEGNKKWVPYVVTGVLLNPYNTRGAADSTASFAQITLQSATAKPSTNYRDIIGYDWKTYNFSAAHYTVNRGKNYILYTQQDQMYKLHFLDFYNSSNDEGSPLFEYERLR